MLKQKPSKEVMMKTKHSSLDLQDSHVLEETNSEEKKPDGKHEMTKSKVAGDIWWNRFTNFGDVLKSKNNNAQEATNKKSKKQMTLDYFLKPRAKSESVKVCKKAPESPKKVKENGRPTCLQKQISVGSYPVLVNIPEEVNIVRSKSNILCDGKGVTEPVSSALERPRKKLSFREPEITGYSKQIFSETLPRKNIKPFTTPQLSRNCGTSNGIQKWTSYEDLDLESQAMRVVRTVGQAFEVCHKLSITGPSPEEELRNEEDEETTQLSQDLQSDILASDKPSTLNIKRDTLSECNASDRGSVACIEEASDRGAGCASSAADIGPPDPTLPRPQPPPTLDILAPPPNSTSTSNNLRRSDMGIAETYVSPLTEPLRSATGTLPAAGTALSAHHELQLLREQLEQQTQQTQAAFAQIQLLRDQLAAEQSARLEAQARTHQLLVHNKELLDHITALVSHLQDNERSGSHAQQPHVTIVPQQLSGLCDPYQTDRSDANSLDQNAVYQALGLIENRSATTCLPPSPLRNSFTQPPNVFGYNYPQSAALEQSHQLLQRLQSLSGYTPPNLSPFSASYPPTPPLIQYPYAPPMYSAPNLNNAYTLQPPPQKKLPPSPLALRHPQFSGSPVLDRRPSPIKPEPEEKKHTPPACEKTENTETQFIKPLSQVGTLTATDNEGRVRVIVPVPSGAEDAGDLLRALRMSDDFSKGASTSAITRSTSEKVPNRSELMSQVQRTAWARHTTK